MEENGKFKREAPSSNVRPNCLLNWRTLRSMGGITLLSLTLTSPEVGCEYVTRATEF